MAFTVTFKTMFNTAAWMVSTEAGRDVCEATIKEIYKEMDELARRIGR